MSASENETAEKPLEKMTATELRELAKDIPEITGAHGKKKDELLSEIKKAKGITDKPDKKADLSISEIKKKIRKLKVERETVLKSNNKKMTTIYRRRIARLKKKTRRAAQPDQGAGIGDQGSVV
jgi:hypothetical protein